MPPAPRIRTSWTIKHASMTAELRMLVSKAAEMQGMGVGEWIGHTLRERATAVVKGEVPPAGLPVVAPARIDSIEERLAALEGALRARRRWWPW